MSPFLKDNLKRFSICVSNVLDAAVEVIVGAIDRALTMKHKGVLMKQYYVVPP